MGGNQAEPTKPGRQMFNVDQSVRRGFQSMMIETLKSGRKGQDLVEFAVMLPFLLIVLIGVVDLGRVFHASITLANASRTGARYATSYGFEDVGGVVTINSAAVTSRAQTEAQNSGITLDSVVTNCPGSCARGGPVVVTVTHNFNFLFNAYIGSGLTLSHSSEMKIPW